MNEEYWITTVKDINDGSGDCYIELPAELIEKIGWNEDTELSFELRDDCIVLQKQ